MRKLGAYRKEEVIGALLRAGFVLSREKGAVRRYVHRDDATRTVTIVTNGRFRDVPREAVLEILKQAGVSRDEFLKFV